MFSPGGAEVFQMNITIFWKKWWFINEKIIRKFLNDNLSLPENTIAYIIQELNIKSRVSLCSKDTFIKVCNPKEEKYYESFW